MKFHVKQALVLLIASIAVSIVGWVLIWIPVIGWIAFIVLRLGVLALWIMGLVGAIQGKQKEVPVLGSLAKNFNF